MKKKFIVPVFCLLLIGVFFGVSAESWSDSFDGNVSEQMWVNYTVNGTNSFYFINDRYEISVNHSLIGAEASYIEEPVEDCIISAKIQRMNEEDRFLVYLLGRVNATALTGYTLGISSGNNSGNAPHLNLGRLTGNLSKKQIPLDSVFGGFGGTDYSMIPWGYEGDVWYDSYVKFAIVGENLYGKVWKENESEPNEWQVNATDGDYSSGNVGLMVATYPTLGWSFVNVAVDDYYFSNSLNEVWVNKNYNSSTKGWNVTHFASIQNASGVISENGIIRIISEERGSSNITLGREVGNVRLDFFGRINSFENAVNATLNASINIEANTTVGLVTIQIPENVTISGNSSWGGIIDTPIVRNVSSVNVTADSGYSASVLKVIEIGYGDVLLTFDKAVRISIEDQAGKDAGYVRGGVFTKISDTCSNDSQVAGDLLVSGGDCKIDSGDDLIIWTKHFTKFVTYSQSIIPVASVITTPSRGRSCIYDVDYDWECGEWGECINGTQLRECKKYNNCGNSYGRPIVERNCSVGVESGIPEQLFDISLRLEDYIVSSSDELVAKVSFEAFGSEPTPVNLTYVVIDELGREVYLEDDYLVVYTEEFVYKSFDRLNLKKGKYTLVLKTLYDVDVRNEFSKKFGVGDVSGFGITGQVVFDFVRDPFVAGFFVFLLLVIIFFLVKNFSKKRK